MEKEYLVYHIVLNSYLFEDHPEFISQIKTEINPKFDQFQISFGRKRVLEDWTENVTVYFSGWRNSDYDFCISNIRIISDRAKTVIEKVAKDQIEFLPIKSIFLDPKADPRMKFWAINVINIVDALDWDSTIWSRNPPPKKDDIDAWFSIIKPRLFANKIINQHILGMKLLEKVILLFLFRMN